MSTPRRNWITAIVVAAAAVAATGCLPRTFVRKNPLPNDKGIRYYRPKPYLKLAPHLNPITGEASATHVHIELVYMPDFSEEYSIHMRSGFGVNNSKITLDQGWNLVGLDVQLDSKTAENIEAVGSLLGSIAGKAAASLDDRRTSTPDGFVIAATNVPLGFYEAVLGPSDCGKQLYGFRYVGFLPYATCPTTGCGGTDRFECHGGPHELYGLVFESGVMTFKRIGEIQEGSQAVNTCRHPARMPGDKDPDAAKNRDDDRGMVPAEPVPANAARAATAQPPVQPPRPGAAGIDPPPQSPPGPAGTIPSLPAPAPVTPPRGSGSLWRQFPGIGRS